MSSCTVSLSVFKVQACAQTMKSASWCTLVGIGQNLVFRLQEGHLVGWAWHQYSGGTQTELDHIENNTALDEVAGLVLL